jgi:hypothetical protein
MHEPRVTQRLPTNKWGRRLTAPYSILVVPRLLFGVVRLGFPQDRLDLLRRAVGQRRRVPGQDLLRLDADVVGRDLAPRGPLRIPLLAIRLGR